MLGVDCDSCVKTGDRFEIMVSAHFPDRGNKGNWGPAILAAGAGPFVGNYTYCDPRTDRTVALGSEF